MKSVFLFSVAAICAFIMTASEAFAARNSYEPSSTFSRFASYDNRLQEATALKSDAQDRKDDAEAAIREGEFAGRSLFNSLLDRAESDMFAAGPGDSGQGNLNGEIYTWLVSATERTFTLNGQDIFIVSCGAGGC